MHYLKSNAKLGILAFLLIVLPLVKAQPLLTGSYNWTFSANHRNDENLLIIDDPKIIALREELGGFKSPQDLTQLPEITNLDWQEWKEEGIIISVK